MKGFSVSGNSDGIQIVEEPFESGEKDFEIFLETHPDVLPANEINPLIKAVIPIGRQVTVGSNAVDLLFLANTGHLLVVECKLIHNPEARREVVSQLLEYCATIVSSWDSKHVLSIAEEYYSKRNAGKFTTVTSRLNTVFNSSEPNQTVTESVLKKRIDRHIKQPILILAGNRIEQRALVLADFLRKQKLPIFV